jgi:hypothetical protein
MGWVFEAPSPTVKSVDGHLSRHNAEIKNSLRVTAVLRAEAKDDVVSNTLDFKALCLYYNPKLWIGSIWWALVGITHTTNRIMAPMIIA